MKELRKLTLDCQTLPLFIEIRKALHRVQVSLRLDAPAEAVALICNQKTAGRPSACLVQLGKTLPAVASDIVFLSLMEITISVPTAYCEELPLHPT